MLKSTISVKQIRGLYYIEEPAKETAKELVAEPTEELAEKAPAHFGKKSAEQSTQKSAQKSATNAANQPGKQNGNKSTQEAPGPSEQKSRTQVKRFKPWLGDAFSFLYDFFMEQSVFPKKFDADIDRHYEILKEALSDIHDNRVLELATGNGSAADFLPTDNVYIGTDISPGLLRKAAKRLKAAGFRDADLYVVSADDLPFEDGAFDVCLCMLSLNFFDDAKTVIKEVRRVSAPGGSFFCSAPVPERKKTESPIRGTLYSEDELHAMCEELGLQFHAFDHHNGALLYWKAVKPS